MGKESVTISFICCWLLFLVVCWYWISFWSLFEFLEGFSGNGFWYFWGLTSVTEPYKKDCVGCDYSVVLINLAKGLLLAIIFPSLLF